MGSGAERRRRTRAKAQSRAAAAKAVQPLASVRSAKTPKPNTPYAPREKSGIEWLLSKNRLTPLQFRAGRKYAELFRGVCLGSEVSIKSNLAALDDPRAGGTPTHRLRTSQELETAEWIADCRSEMIAARLKLAFHPDIQGAVDVICGKGLLIRDLTKDFRVADIIEAHLKIGLDALAEHWWPTRNRMSQEAA